MDLLVAGLGRARECRTCAKSPKAREPDRSPGRAACREGSPRLADSGEPRGRTRKKSHFGGQMRATLNQGGSVPRDVGRRVGALG